MAPVWSKTYKDFSTQPSTYYTPPASAGGYTGNGNAMGNSYSKGSLSKSSFGSNIGVTSYEERMKLEAMRTEKADSQAKLYFKNLNEFDPE